MTTYLSMDGTSDYIQLPSMTIKKLVFDVVFPTQTTNKMILDARVGQTNGYVYANSDGSLTTAGASFQVTGYVRDTRATVTFNAINNIDGNGNFTDNVTIFANNTGGENCKGFIYSIKCYNASNVLVAHYDMSKRTLQDQTGNGNHATLTGGTWLNDFENVLISDSFNRANNTTLGSSDSYVGGTSKTWTTNGTRGITSNQAYVNTDYGGVGIDTGVTEFNVQVTFSNIVNEPTLIFRRVDSNVAVGVVALSSSYAIKGFNFNEGWMTYSSYPTTPVNGDVIKVEILSNIAKVYLNGSLIITWSISNQYSPSTTSVGLRSLDSTNKFDNFVVSMPILSTNGLVGYWNSKQGVVAQTSLGQIDFDTGISNYVRGQTYTFTVASGSRSTFDSAGVQVGDYITNNAVLNDNFATIEAINGYNLTVRCWKNTTDGSPSQWAGEYIVRNTWSNLAPNTSTKYRATICGGVANSNGMNFNGVNSIIQFPKIDELQTSNGDYTFELRMKLTTYSGQDVLVTTENRTIYFPTNTGHTVRVYNATDTTRDSETFNGTLTNDNEYYISFTFNNTSKLGSLYVNGSLLSTITYPAGFGALLPSTEYLNIGSSATPLNGYVDNIRLYNRELTSSEVSQNYNVKTSIGLQSGGGVIDAGTFLLTGDSSLSPISNVLWSGLSSLSSDTTLTPIGSLLLDGGLLTVTGDTTLNSIGSLILNGLTTLTGDTVLTSDGTIISASVSVDLVAQTNLTPDGTAKYSGDSTISADSSVNPIPSILLNSDSSFSADSSLSSIPSIILNALSSISADSILTSDGSVATLSISVNLDASGDLNAIGSVVIGGTSNLSATTNLNALAILSSDVVLVDIIHLKGQRSLTVNLTGKKDSLVKLVGSREMTIHLKGGIQ